MPDRRLLAALLLVAGPGFADAPVRPTDLEHLVKQDCGSCHGLTLGGGLGPDIRPAALHGMPADVLAEVILDGRPGTAMPPWRPLLTDREAAWIAEYLLSGGAE